MKTNDELFEKWRASSIDVQGGSNYSVKSAYMAGQAAERAECAKICDEGFNLFPSQLSALIRARGER